MAAGRPPGHRQPGSRGDVGTEVDLNVVYNLDRQVTLFGFLGWLGMAFRF